MVDRRRAPPTRAHAPPGMPHGIASQGGVESPVARGRAGSAVTCSRQCIRNISAWCASVDGLRHAAVSGQPARRRRCGLEGRGASLLPAAAALGEEVRARSQRSDVAIGARRARGAWRARGAAVSSVAMARRARGALVARGTAVSGVARRWAASRWRRCGRAGRGASLRPAAAAHGEEVRALAYKG